MPKKDSLFPNPSKDQCKDAGLALILVLLLVVKIGGYDKVLPFVILATLLLMIWPKLFKPFAMLWFGLSELMGTVMSKVILTVIFFLVVSPIALLRKIGGKDSLKLKQWRNNKDSVFRVRDELVTPEDLQNMF